MTLPSHGWKGYGRPGYIPVSLRPHFTTEAREQYEREVEEPREARFKQWQRDTLWPQAIARWVREIGERA